MADNLNISQFSNLAKRLLEKYDNGEEFLLGDVHRQIRTAYEKFPEDAVIRQMSSVVEKMAEKYSSATIVNQRQLSSIYNDLVRLAGETKFRTVLGHLLLAAPEQKRASSAELRDDRKEIAVKDLVGDEVIGVLESAFDDDLAAKAFNQELANNGIGYIRAELKSLGFSSNVIKIASGNGSKVVYSASFDTQRGPVSVYIPVSVANNKFMLPTTFIDDLGESQLNKETLGSSIQRRAMAEIGKPMPEAVLPDLDLNPKVEMPKELAHLTHDFENSVLETTSIFGKEAVDMGKRIVIAELKAAGFKNAQVKFGSDSGDSVVYLASINTPRAGVATIEVPIEMKATMDDKYAPLLPTCFAYNEQLKEFNASNLQKFALEATNVNTESNPLYSFMLLPELKEEMIRSASINDYNSCEAILNHIGEKFGEEDYKNAIADYQYVLSMKNKAADDQAKQAEIANLGVLIPAGKGSIYPRLPNGKPIKDMVKDESGRFRSATEIEKEKLNKTEDGGAAIQTSQILFN